MEPVRDFDFTELSVRCRNVLKNAGIFTADQLKQIVAKNGFNSLMKIQGLGPKCYDELSNYFISRELAPCPFCGNKEPHIVVDLYGKNYIALCESCGASIRAHWGRGCKEPLGTHYIKRLYDHVPERERDIYARWTVIKKWNNRTGGKD